MPFYRTFMRVTVPICMPAILDIAVYMFVNALTTVSAVIFIYGASNKLASISVVHMDEAGATAAAAGDGDADRADGAGGKGAAPGAGQAGVRQAAGLAEAIGVIPALVAGIHRAAGSGAC